MPQIAADPDMLFNLTGNTTLDNGRLSRMHAVSDHQTEPFQNRTNEIQWITADMHGHLQGGRVLILHGSSGRGKSRLTKEVAHTYPDRVVVRVAPPKGRAGLADNALFLRMLGRAFDVEMASRQATDFGTWLRRTPLGTRLRKAATATARLGATAAGVPGQAIDIAGSILGTNSRSEHAEFAFASTYLIGLVEQYVELVMSEQRLLLIIENAQAMDDESAVALRSALGGAKCTYCILEYTTETDTRIAVETADFYRGPTTVADAVELSPLSAEHVVTLLREQPGAMQRFVQDQWQSSSGNLRAVIDLQSRRTGFPETLDHASFARLKSLPEGQQFLLVLVAVHGGEIDDATIEELSVPVAAAGLSAEPTVLVAEIWNNTDILTRSNASVRFAHDSLADVLVRNQAFLRYRLLAYRILQRHYGWALRDSGSVSADKLDALALLLECAVALDDQSQAIRVVDAVEGFLGDVRTTKRLARCLSQIVSRVERGSQDIRSRFTDTLAIRLAHICSHSGAYRQGLDVVQALPTNHPRRRLYEAVFMNLLSDYKAALEHTSTWGEADSRSERLLLAIVRMSALRCVGKMRAVQSLYKRVWEDSDLVSCREWPYLLRASEMALPPLKAVPMLLSAAEKFEDVGLALQAAKTRVNVSLPLCRLGELDKAAEQLERAEQQSLDLGQELYSVHNNRAAVTLHRSSSDGVVELLMQAKLGTTNEFNRFIVESNLLAAHVLARDISGAKGVASSVQRSIDGNQPPDESMRRIAAWNMFRYFEVAGEFDLAARFKELCASATSGSLPAYWEAKLDGRIDVEGEAVGRLINTIEPACISYWTIDLDDHLMSS